MQSHKVLSGSPRKSSGLLVVADFVVSSKKSALAWQKSRSVRTGCVVSPRDSRAAASSLSRFSSSLDTDGATGDLEPRGLRSRGGAASLVLLRSLCARKGWRHPLSRMLQPSECQAERTGREDRQAGRQGGRASRREATLVPLSMARL